MYRRVYTHAWCAKIFRGDRATGLAHEACDLFGDVPLIDGVARGHDRVRAPLALMRTLDRRQSTEERAEITLDEDLPHPRRASVRQEHRRARRPLPQTFGEPLDRRSEAGIDGKAVAELDRRGEDLGEGEAAVTRERRQPRVGGRGRDRSSDTDWHVVTVRGAIGLEIERR